MKSIILTSIVLVSAHFRYVAAKSTIEKEETESVARMRSVTLGIFLLYDETVTHSTRAEGIILGINDYFKILVAMAERVHFGNVNSTNISLVFMGSRKINVSHTTAQIW